MSDMSKTNPFSRLTCLYHLAALVQPHTHTTTGYTTLFWLKTAGSKPHPFAKLGQPIAEGSDDAVVPRKAGAPLRRLLELPIPMLIHECVVEVGVSTEASSCS